MAKPASAVQDPYASSAAGQDGISFVPPPPGAPTDGTATLMKIFVPAEDTHMDLGVGSPPGIRMFTAHHVGLWAGAPQTTVFLGTNAGGVDGIDIYTAAQKREVIALPTGESYQKTKTETVGLALTENYNDKKTENVAQALVENYHGTKNETVDQAVVESFGATKQQTIHQPATNHYLSTLTEDVGGNWTVDPVKGDFTVHANGKIDIHGDASCKYQVGATDWLFMNNFKKTTIGSDTAIIIGNRNDIRLALHNDVRVGGHMDTKLAVRVVNQLAPWKENNVLRKMDGALKSLTTAMYATGGGTITLLNKAASFIDSASLYILN